MPYLAAGIDIGSYSTKVVFAKIGVKSIQTVSFREFVYERDEEGKIIDGQIQKAITECISLGGHNPVTWHASIPDSEVFTRKLLIPKAAVKKLDSIAPMQIEDELPVEIGEYIIDSISTTLAPDGTNITCFVAAVKKDFLQQFLSTLASSGLDPAELGYGLSIYPFTSASQGLSTTPQPFAILNIGHSHSQLYIQNGKTPIFIRSVLWGADAITKKIMKAMSIPYSQAQSIKEIYCSLYPPESEPDEKRRHLIEVCRQTVSTLIPPLRQSLMSVAAKEGIYPKRIMLCGGGSKIKGIDQYLKEKLSADIERMERGENIPAQFIPAKTMAEKVEAGGIKRINFRKEQFEYKGKIDVLKRKWLRGIYAISAIVAGWLILSFAQIHSYRSIIEGQRAKLEQVTESATGKKISDFDRAELMLKKTKPPRNPAPEADAYDIIEWISKSIPEDLIHDLEEIDIKPERWRIRGIVDSISDRDRLYEILMEYKKCVKKINKGKTTLSVKDNRQKYHFDLETKCP